MIVVPYLAMPSTFSVAPTKGTPGSTGWDVRLCATHHKIVTNSPVGLMTGIAIAPPPGIAFAVRGRSGLAARGMQVHHGTIDNDYRGFIMVIAWTVAAYTPVSINPGDRIAQLVLEGDPFREIQWKPVTQGEFDALSTERGSGGIGSTGA